MDDYKGLIDLARSQGALGGLNRGACKKCGQLGHLTKQCRNQFSRFFDGAPGDANTAAAAAAAGTHTGCLTHGPTSPINPRTASEHTTSVPIQVCPPDGCMRFSSEHCTDDATKAE